MSEYGKRLVKGGTLILISTVVLRFVGIFRSGIVARFLGPHDLGVLSIVNNILDIVLQIAIMSIPIGIAKLVSEHSVKEKNANKKIASTGLFLILVFTGVMSAVLYALAPTIAQYYADPRIEFYLRFYSFFLFIPALVHFLNAILQGYHKMNYLSIFNMTVGFIGLPIIFVLSKYYGIFGVIVTSLIISLLGVLLSLYGVRKTTNKLDFSPAKFSNRYAMSIFSLSIPIFIGAIIYRPVNLIVKSYIYVVLDPVSVGYYHIAFTIYAVLMMIPSSLQTPLLPILSEANSVNRSEFKAFNTKLVRIMSVLMIAISSLVILFSGPIVMIIYGNAYLSAIPLLAVLAGASYFMSINALLMSATVGSGNTKLMILIDLVQAFTILSISYYLIPAIGVIAMGIVFFITGTVALIVYLLFFKRLNLIDVSKILKNVIVGGIVVLLCSVLMVNLTFSLFTVIISLVVYLLILSLCYKLLKKNEREMIKNLIMSRF